MYRPVRPRLCKRFCPDWSTAQLTVRRNVKSADNCSFSVFPEQGLRVPEVAPDLGTL